VDRNTELLGELARRILHVLVVHACEQHRGALGDKTMHDPEADPSGGTCHDSPLAAEP
jgi:hypothetical protein